MVSTRLAIGFLSAVIAGCGADMRESQPSSRPPAQLADCRSVIQDPKRSDDDVFYAIEAVRSYSAGNIPARFWSDIANNSVYTDARRRWAVLQLFDRYLQPHWTLREFGKLLAAPKWLRQDQIVYIDVPKGGTGGPLPFPIDLDRGDSMVGIRVSLPVADDSMIYLRLGTRPDPREIYAALMGKPSPADDTQVREIAPYFRGAENIGGMHWRGGAWKSPYEQSVDLKKTNLGGQ